MTGSVAEDVRLLRVREVAARLSLTPPTIYKLIASGELPAVEIGGVLRVHPDVVARYFDRARETA